MMLPSGGKFELKIDKISRKFFTGGVPQVEKIPYDNEIFIFSTFYPGTKN